MCLESATSEALLTSARVLSNRFPSPFAMINGSEPSVSERSLNTAGGPPRLFSNAQQARHS